MTITVKCRSCLGTFTDHHDGLCVECFYDEYDKLKLQKSELSELISMKNLQIASMEAEMLGIRKKELETNRLNDARGMKLHRISILIGSVPCGCRTGRATPVQCNVCKIMDILAGEATTTEKRNDEIKGIKADGTGTTRDRCHRRYPNPGIEMSCAGALGCNCGCHKLTRCYHTNRRNMDGRWTCITCGVSL